MSRLRIKKTTSHVVSRRMREAKDKINTEMMVWCEMNTPSISSAVIINSQTVPPTNSRLTLFTQQKKLESQQQVNHQIHIKVMLQEPD